MININILPMLPISKIDEKKQLFYPKITISLPKLSIPLQFKFKVWVFISPIETESFTTLSLETETVVLFELKRYKFPSAFRILNVTNGGGRNSGSIFEVEEVCSDCTWFSSWLCFLLTCTFTLFGLLKVYFVIEKNAQPPNPSPSQYTNTHELKKT